MARNEHDAPTRHPAAVTGGRDVGPVRQVGQRADRRADRVRGVITINGGDETFASYQAVVDMIDTFAPALG